MVGIRIDILVGTPSYPNWQRKRIQNPCSVSSNLTEGTRKIGSDGFFDVADVAARPSTQTFLGTRVI